MKNKQRKLEIEILKHKELYYSGKAIISDEEYDQLENELRRIAPDSGVLSYVGAPVIGEKVAHDKKMLSLAKTYDMSELQKWCSVDEVMATFKVDGSSCSLIYSNGELELAKTRGDGNFGENITAKIKFVNGVPLIIKNKSRIEIRGEVFCKDKNFIELSDEMLDRGLERPESLRNIVAGLLGRKENIDLCQYLDFQAFELIEEELHETETQKLKLLKTLGFNLPEHNLIQNQKALESFVNETSAFIENGDYLIDGCVFTYNKISLHEELGETSHHPRYKMAFKFQGETKEAVINDISWQVSRNGVLTPVANIEPVELSSAKISRVTLHNYGIVKEFLLKAGDCIEIVRSGEVIPKFLRVIESCDNEFSYPIKCPSCESKLSIQDIRLICENKNCPSKVLEEIVFFAASIGIDDISRKRFEEMIKSDLLVDIPSLYKITQDQLLNLDKVKEKLASKMYENIQKSKDADLVTFMTALGINGLGKTKCEKILDAGLDELSKILCMSVEELVEIDGFAQKSAQDIINSINEKRELIQALIEVGFNPKSALIKTESAISGKKFCITGTLSMKRSDIQKIIKENSGQVVSSVSSATDYLVTNDTESTSSKFVKAKQLNIPIINEEKLLSLIGK